MTRRERGPGVSEMYAGTLTDQQIADTVALRDDWMRTALSTERCDRAGAEQAVFAAYETAGLPRPPVVVWMDSPPGGLLASAVLRHHVLPANRAQLRDQIRDQLGDQLRVQLGDQIRDQLRDQLRVQLGGQLGDQLRVQLGVQLWDQLWDQLGGQLGVQLWDQLWDQLGGQLWDQLGDQLWDQLWDQLGDQLWDQLGDQLGPQLTGQIGPWRDAYWAVFYTRAMDIAGLGRPPRLDSMAAAVKAVDCWWPLRGAVVLTDRPTVLCRDGQGRLHRDGGPALTYADGYHGHWWHGVAVPADLVEGDGWALDQVLRERNAEVRRCAIERRGWDRFVAEASLVQVGGATPDPGNPGRVLRLYDLPAALVDLYDEPARILICDNASLDRDGTRRSFGLPVPADVPDPISAAAATFGVSAAEYATLARAT
jgi:hypothetical protein